MPKNSAGLLLFRLCGGEDIVEVLLAHPGGPFWAKKDDGAWSIPKGEFDEGESALEAAKREFAEESGITPQGEFLSLGTVSQSKAKTIHAWALRGDWDLSGFRSNVFQMEWPPHSGKQREFPEVDRMEWFPLDQARQKLLKGQIALLDRLQQLLDSQGSSSQDRSSQGSS
jgi:predicted NUDIX family NTP pyrophosphohydrolase